jgi:hypothetical protein
MIEIRTKLRASALALALAGFTTVGCVDNSGNKTYPRSDAGSTDVAADTASDTPVTGDAPSGDTATPTDTATPGDTATPADTAADRADTATGGGDAGDAPGIDVRPDVPPLG